MSGAFLMTKFDAIIFDCDGVLVDSEVLAIRGERRALADYGLDYSAAEFVRRFVGLHDDAFWTALRADYHDKHNRPAPDDFAEVILAARREEMAALQVIEGAAQALQAHPCVAVASSSRAHFLESKLKRMGLWEHAAPHVYSADLVENGKPAPDIFLYTAERLGVAPTRCLVLEDSENGVRAGVAAGMRVWGFLGGGHIFEGHGERLRTAGAVDNAENFATFISMLDAE